ncbi:hypothetical protein FB45DRAFT_730788, partial [Roridomyces roridus]
HFTQKSLPFSVIASHIRLGRKYDLQEFLQAMVQRLTHENPRTLEEYDLLRMPDGRYPPTLVDWYPGLIVDLLALARENNLFALLPCAYLRLLSSTLSNKAELLTGIGRPDGSLAKLSPEDQRVCILGQTELTRRQWEAQHTFGWVAQKNAVPDPQTAHTILRAQTPG